MTGIEPAPPVVDAWVVSDLNWFSGKLVKRHLPRVVPGEGVDLPSLKRLVLPQGELAQFHDSETPAHYIAAIELVAGTVRGNHYHDSKVEHVYLMRGEMELVARRMATGEQVGVEMEPGDLAIIQPGVAHALRILQPGVAIEFAPGRFDPADIHRFELI